MESVIEKIRSIMRKEGVTGMDSINHCIIFVISRMLDEDKCTKFGIDKKNSYYNIMHDEDGDLIGSQELYSRIYTKNDTTCLVIQIATKLKFSNIKFKLESPQHVEQIMKELEKLDMTKLETKYDIIGTIYEYHLKSGTSNAMRDLGQYYTNRQVIEFMIKLCDINMNKKGEIETIIDPTMGTGGFLTMSVKYLNDKYKNKIDWSKNKNRIYGFDIDENVKNMAMLNMLLECGEFCENTFIKNDTLYNDFKLKNGEILEKVDVILANEPMGIKNIIHANCCERIKELKFRGTKAEPLFLQLFMQSLKENGRCAVIVPDGVLFNDSNLHSDTRKHLVENFNLKKVISLNDDFFLNTGVKTSILYFVNDGKTLEVEFSELKLKKDELTENSIIKVKYDKVVEINYSLFVNKYNTKEVVKVEGVKYKKLGDICEFLPKSKRQASYGKDEGIYPFYTSGMTVKKCDECDYNDESIIIGTGGTANIKYNNNFSCSADNFILKFNKNISTKYIYYYFLININILENGFCGSTIKHISKDYVQKIEIPIPSLSIQKKIVEQLDVIYKNIQTCKEQIEESKKIIKYYIESMTFWERDEQIKLINIVEKKSGKSLQKNNMLDGTYPVISGGANYGGYHSEYNYNEPLIFIARVGTAGYISKIKDKCYVTDLVGAYKIINKSYLFDYIYYYLKNNEDNIKNIYVMKTGAPSINLTKFIDDYTIPNLNIDKQKEIVEQCDKISNNIKSLKETITFNETLMKNIMGTYLKTDNKSIISEKESDKSESSEEEDNEPKKNVKTKETKDIKQVTKKTKKQETSSESSESESSEDEPVKKPLKEVKPVKKTKQTKKQETSSESESEDELPKKKTKATAKSK
jgi:type I restriction-modification system DNA methylase subunit